MVAEWSTTLAALAGGVVGIAGVVLSQMLAQRTAMKRDRESRVEQNRRELRLAIQDYVRATQQAEYAAGAEDPERRGVAHIAMWFAHKSLGLIADLELMSIADRYSNAVNDCLWSLSEQPAWERVQTVAREFLQAARQRV